MSAATTPSEICQFASPVVVHPARLVPSNNVVHGASGAARPALGPWPGPQAANTLIVATATTPRSMSSPIAPLPTLGHDLRSRRSDQQPRFGGSLAARPSEHYRAGQRGE